MLAQHHDHRIAHARKQAHQPLDEGFAAIIEQSLGAAHASGRPSGEDNSRDHFNSARRFWCAKTDFESVRHSTSGVRRMAIISATTEMAISSGVSAPISSPIGAKIFSKV